MPYVAQGLLTLGAYPWRIKWAIVCGVFCSISMVGYFLFYIPNVGRLKTLVQQTRQLKAQAHQWQVKYKHLLAKPVCSPELRRQAIQYLRPVSQSYQSYQSKETLAMMMKAAQQAHLLIMDFQEMPEIIEGGTNIWPFALTVQGQFLGLNQFLVFLINHIRGANLMQIRLSSIGQEKAMLLLQVDVNVMRFVTNRSDDNDHA